MPPRIIVEIWSVFNTVEYAQERKVINKNIPPKIKQEIVPANPTAPIITILPVSDKYDLDSFVSEFFNFDQIKIRTKL